MLLRELKEMYKKSEFDFSGMNCLVAFFTNPSYIIRKNLFRSIKKYAFFIDGNVLDFGCGSKPYEHLFIKCKSYVGCDIDVSGHSHQNEKIDCYYNGKSLPFADQSFDWVFSSEVFEHIFNLDEILDELNRILVDRGGMLVTIPFIWNEHETPYDCVRYTSFGIKELLERHGFEVLELHKSSTGIEAILQVTLIYLSGLIEKISFCNKYIAAVIRCTFFPPVILLTMFLAKLFPGGKEFYLNNIILCKKCSIR